MEKEEIIRSVGEQLETATWASAFVTGQVLWSTACAQARQRRTQMRTPLLLGERA
jgi:hypothetical protein